MERFGPEAFSGRRLNRPGSWAVVFLATWCPFCREFAPQFAHLARTSGHLAVGDLTDLGNPLWETFDIEVVPTVLVFRDGKLLRRVDGRPMEGLGPADVRDIEAALDAP